MPSLPSEMRDEVYRYFFVAPEAFILETIRQAGSDWDHLSTVKIRRPQNNVLSLFFTLPPDLS
jgi:hypothetical protein